MSEEEKTFQASWNLSQYMTQTIMEYINNGCRELSNYNLSSAFKQFEACKLLVTPYFKKDERRWFEIRENIIMKRIYLDMNDDIEQENNKIYYANRLKLERSLKEYASYLMDLLRKYNFLVSEKEDSTQMA